MKLNGMSLTTKIVTVPMPQPTVGGLSLVELGKRLLDAAKRGETDTVRALMSNGAPFTTDWLGTSPLHFAAQNGHLGTAEVLLRAGISRDARTKVDRTPLHVACQEGHLDIVQLLLQNSADIDAKDMLKMTPLHWATDKGNDTIIDCLIKNGADINCTDKFERTPLDIAMANGRTDLAQALQLAQMNFEQHTELAGVSEESTVTVETTEATESVIDASHIKQEVVDAESSDSSSTSVLATLAALAEATGPINAQNMTSSEAMNWLETQGITMISTSEGNIITSALESGQSVQLTEAGKIALNFIRSQALNTEGTVTEDATIDSVVGDAGDQKVITIVTQPGSEIPTEDVPVLVTVATDDAEVSPEDQIVEATEEEAVIETVQSDGVFAEEEAVIETEPASLEVAGVLDVDISTLTEKDSNEHRLQKQLLEMQRQAEAYKERLRQKEQEAEDYRKQLSEMKTSNKKE